MADYDYDLFVIGGGSGGVRAARISAQLGARVALAEELYLGGTCVNAGCVPKKMFVYASHYHEDFQDARGFGWESTQPGFDWPTLRDNKDTEIQRLNGVYDKLLNGAGVTVLQGRAVPSGPHSVTLNGREITARYILIAVGGWPFVPDIPGAELAITSNEAFHLEAFPRRAVVVGGGYIAVEFAGIFAGLGADTELVYRGPMFLRKFDEDVRKVVAEECAKKGIRLRFETNISAIRKQEDGLVCELDGGGELATDLVMYATGRKPKVDGLNLEQVGVRTRDNGVIEVDDGFRTSVPSIFALGDVIGRVELTPVALAEGMALAHALFNDRPVAMDYANIATAVFCQPNIGTVGLSEEEARKQGSGKLRVYRSRFRPLKHTISARDETTFLKMIVDDASDRVLGIHMVGPEAGEIIQGMAVALKAGARKQDFDATIGIHPTTAEEFVTLRTPDPD